MRKHTKKQIVLFVLMPVCTLLFIAIEGYLTIYLIGAIPQVAGSDFAILYICTYIILQVATALFYGLFIWLAVGSIKPEQHIKKPETKKILTVLIIICTALFAGLMYFLTRNLINLCSTILPTVQNEYPEMANAILKDVYLSIAFQSTFTFLYGLFMWLAISTAKKGLAKFSQSCMDS